MKLAHLKRKSVINMYNGNFVGYIKDVVIVFPNGNIETLIIKPSFVKRMLSLFTAYNKVYISWDNIISIGKDVILVNIIDN